MDVNQNQPDIKYKYRRIPSLYMESTKEFEIHKAYEGEAMESLFSEITKEIDMS